MMLGQTEWAKLMLADRYQEAENARLARRVKQATKAARPLTSSRRRHTLRRLRELPTRN
jgi:hypothetical protein